MEFSTLGKFLHAECGRMRFTMTSGNLVQLLMRMEEKLNYMERRSMEFFAKHARASMMSATELIDVIEGYVREVQEVVEKKWRRIQTSETASNCKYVDSCACPKCKKEGEKWDKASLELDYRSISVTHAPGLKPSYRKSKDAHNSLHRKSGTQQESCSRRNWNANSA